MAQNTFSVVRDLSRREIEAHQKRFVGITVTIPEHREIDGKLEWVCDVRVGYNQDWAVVRDVTISQWALGIVTDMNVPVLCERGESGQVTIIARSQVLLPDIVLTVYTHDELGFDFMHGLEDDGTGTYRDGFGYAVNVPTGSQETVYQHTQTAAEFGSADFVFGTTNMNEFESEWEEV